MVHVSRLPIILICAAMLTLSGCGGWLESRLDGLEPTATDPNKEPVGYNG